MGDMLQAALKRPDPTKRRADFERLCQGLDALQTEAFRLGLQVTGHAINNAKNASGWEFSGDIENAARASKGVRPGESLEGRRGAT